MVQERLYAIVSKQIIKPRWTNFDGTPTIYITSNTGLNIVELTLENQLGDTVTLPAGKPVAYGSLPIGQSALYIFFEGLLSNTEVENIQITSESSAQWSLANFTDTSGFAYLVLAPNSQVQVENGQGLEFKLTNILASSSISGSIYIDIVGATGIDSMQMNTQVFVNVQNQPSTANQELDLLVGFAGSDLVFTGGQTNELVLYLTNPNSTALVPGGSNSWGPTPPTFQLSLVFGDGSGALTSAADANSIAVNIGDVFGNVWHPVARQQQGVLPTWIMQPNAIGGGIVLGTGENATISFNITNILTQLPQGLTFAYLSYRNIPGYNDGFYGIEILKVNPIIISSFTANPTSITNATGPTTVALAFEVQNASYVTITNTSYASAATSDNFTSSTNVNIYATTTYTLIANNFATGQMLSQSLEISVSPDLFHLVPTGMIVMWSGVSVPVGWSICDGTNGTPNLVSKFVMGSVLNDIGTTGGTSSHSHSANASVNVASEGNHTHGMPSMWYANNASSGDGITIVDRRCTNSPWYTQSAGTHTHNAKANVTVESTKNLPPYYALAFIMKIT